MKKEFYKRNLPHWQPENSVFAVTYHLNGSLPIHIIQQLREEREVEINKLQEEGLNEAEVKERLNELNWLHYGKYDDLLDKPQNDIQHLKNPEIANIIIDSLHHLDDNVWKMVCFCVMSNHVHLIVYQLNQSLTKLMQNHKSFTGRKANEILGLTGSFWQRESYDRKIRDRKEFATQVKYVLFNPVKAGLIDNWQDWKYSWVREEFRYLAP